MSTQAATSIARRDAQASTRRAVGRTLSYCLLLIVTAAVVAPVAWIFLVSLRTQTEYTSYPITFLPTAAHWENYYRAVFE